MPARRTRRMALPLSGWVGGSGGLRAMSRNRSFCCRAASRQAGSMMPCAASRRRWASVAWFRSSRPCARYHDGRRCAISRATTWRSTWARAVGRSTGPGVGSSRARACSRSVPNHTHRPSPRPFTSPWRGAADSGTVFR
ncbi:hypothetical protein FQZ97_881460 [compost metagenome]